MKKMKFLLAFVVVIAMISSIAMAEGFDFAFSSDTVEYSEGGITISIVASGSVTTDTAGLVVKFDNTLWSVAKADMTSDVASSANLVVFGDAINANIEGSGIVMDSTKNILTFVAKPVEGKEKADLIGSTFKITKQEFFDTEWNAITTTESVITVIDSTPVVEDRTVTFMNGTETFATKTVANNTAVEAPATAPTKENHTFKYWSLEEDGAEYDFATPVTANITLYAVFEPIAPVFDGNGDKTNVTIDEQEYTNVFVGNYSITPNAKKWTGCEYYPDTEGFAGTNGKLTFKDGFSFDGAATINFSVAIVGVPDGVGIVVAPVYAD